MFLPQRLRTEARKADRIMRQKAEEIRLRIGRPLSILTDSGEVALGDTEVSKRDIDILIESVRDKLVICDRNDFMLHGNVNYPEVLTNNRNHDIIYNNRIHI